MDLLIQNFISPSMAAEFSNLILIIGCILAVIECFWGFKIIRSVISIIGFIIGAFCGYSIVLSITATVGYALIGALLVGILVSVLSYKVYLAGVFAIAAYGIFSVSLTYLPLEIPLLYIAAALLGLLAGYLAIHYMRPAVIVITALHGGLTAVTALPLISSIPKNNLFYIGLGLAAAGAVIQFLTTKK